MLGRQDWYCTTCLYSFSPRDNSIKWAFGGPSISQRQKRGATSYIHGELAALQRVTNGEACRHAFIFGHPPGFNTFVYSIWRHSICVRNISGSCTYGPFQTLEHEYLYCTCAIHALHEKYIDTLTLKKLAPSPSLLDKKSLPKATKHFLEHASVFFNTKVLCPGHRGPLVTGALTSKSEMMLYS